MKLKINLIFTLISINLTTASKTKHSRLKNTVYNPNDLNDKPSIIHIDIYKNSSDISKHSNTYKCDQTSSELDDFLDNNLGLNEPSTSFEHYEFVDIPKGEMVTLYPENEETLEFDSDLCEGSTSSKNTEIDHTYANKFKCDDSLYEAKEGRFIDLNVSDVTDFVKNENIVEILSHNAQKVLIVSKQNKDFLLDGFKDTKAKDSETCFINNVFKFENEERDEFQKENLNVPETEGFKNTSITYNSSEIVKDFSSSNDLNISNLDNVNRTFEMLETYIGMYISEYISNTYRCCYFKKLKNVNETCRILDFYQLNFEEHSTIFKILPTEELVNKLKLMSEQFDENSIFNQETCDKFVVEFNSKIFDISYSEVFREKICFLSKDQQRLFFYHEVLKLYKHVVDLQELLVLIGLFNYKSCANVIFVIHLINLFIENIENNKVFILCMIYKALVCFHSIGKFDVFIIPLYEVEYGTKKKDLYYFTWELSSFIRTKIKSRIHQHHPKEILHLKLAFLIFLYRYFTFLKYSPVRSEDILSFVKFINKVCFAEDYLLSVNIYYKLRGKNNKE